METESNASLKFFNWSYDAKEKDDFVKELLQVIGDQGRFHKLEHIELRETMKGVRNSLRKDFKKKGIKLVLSNRQMMSDKDTDSYDSDD